jgi:hypothetical protein
MNKISLPIRHLIFLASAACLLALAFIHPPSLAAANKPAPAAATTSEGAGHLVIVRAANLGGVVVGFSIDGKQLSKLHFNEKYDAPIPAGAHTLSVVPVPNSEHATPNDLKLTVEAGKTYRYTIKRDDVRVILK